MKRNRESYLMRYKPDPEPQSPLPMFSYEDWSKPVERRLWASAGQIVRSGLCFLLATAGILAGVWLIGYVGTLGALAALGL